MNIVTSVKVYPQGGTVETVSQKKKYSTSCCPESASKSCLMIRAPLSGKGSKDKRSDEFDFFESCYYLYAFVLIFHCVQGDLYI